MAIKTTSKNTSVTSLILNSFCFKDNGVSVFCPDIKFNFDNDQSDSGKILSNLDIFNQKIKFNCYSSLIS